MSSPVVRACGAVLAVLLAAGCGGGGDGTTAPEVATPASIALSTTSASIAGIGQTLSVNATVRDADGQPIGGAAVAWEVQNPAIATVSGSGANATVTGRERGGTVVTARSGPATASLTLLVRGVTAVQVLPASATLRVGATTPLQATVSAEALVSTEVTWASADPAIATVGADGVVTAVAAGSTTVTASAVGDPRQRATATITVMPPRSVAVSPAALQVGREETRTLTATVMVDPGQPTGVTWRTNRPLIATVDQQGRVTGVTDGLATITAVAIADTTLQASAEVQVVNTVRSITVAPADDTLFLGEARAFTATVLADPGADRRIAWESTDPSVASIGADGTVTAVAFGTATIIARSVADASRTGEATVVVAPRPVVLTVSPPSLDLPPGDTATLVPTVTGEPGISTAVTYTSANPAVASVDSTGAVTAVAAGATTITVTPLADPAKFVAVPVRVGTQRSLTVSPAALQLGRTEVRALVADLVVRDGESTELTWRSNRPLIATVDQQGRVTGVSDGEATITVVAAADTTVRASAQVQVVNTIRSITLDPALDTLFIGQARAFAATIVADQGADERIVWETGDPTVASIDANGTVTAVAHGTTPVVARSVADGSRFGSATLVVAPRPVALVLAPRTLGLTLGSTATIAATVTGDPGTSTAVSWTSRDAAVASVTAAGVVTGVAPGRTTIVATPVADPDRRDSVEVRVTPQLATAWNADRLGGPLIEDVVSLTTPSLNTAFAVNSLGDVFRWDGLTWTVALRGADVGTQFRAVHGEGNHVIAVGTGGRVARWNGSTWTTESSGTTSDLADVWTDGPDHAWAVADDGTIRRRGASGWSGTASGTSERLRAVWGGATLAYAVGDAGTVRRWNGATWESVDAGTTRSLRDVWARDTAATELAIVGDFGTILRGTPTGLQPEASGTTVPLTSVSGAVGAGVVASGDGLLLERLPEGWRPQTLPYRTRFGAVQVQPGGRVWLGGQRGLVLRRIGEAWGTLSLTPDLLDAWSSGPAHAVAVGELGFIWSWNGSTWNRQEAPTLERLNTVWSPSPQMAFAGGDGGELLRWDGTAWTRETSPTNSPVYAMWGRTPTDVWAVTDAGEVLHRDAGGWRVDHDAPQPLYGIWGTEDGALFAVGRDGLALSRTPSGWTTVPTATSHILVGAWSADASSLLTVGARTFSDGVALRWNGGADWSEVDPATTRVLSAVWGPQAADVYAVGDGGTVVRWDGAVWRPMTSGTTDFLWAVTGSPDGDGAGFAVGLNGTVLTGVPAAFSGRRLGAVAGRMAARRPVALAPSPRAEPATASVLPDGTARRRRR